jgi:hypothetical protein
MGATHKSPCHENATCLPSGDGAGNRAKPYRRLRNAAAKQTAAQTRQKERTNPHIGSIGSPPRAGVLPPVAPKCSAGVIIPVVRAEFTIAPLLQVPPRFARGTLKSAILTSPHHTPLNNKTPIGYPYPYDDKQQTAQDRTTRWATPQHTPSIPPPTPHQHHTPPHHTTRTLPHPPTTHPRRTHHPRTQNHRPTRTHPTPLPQPHPQPLLPTLPTLLRPRRRLPAPVPPYPPRRPHRPPLHRRP